MLPKNFRPRRPTPQEERRAEELQEEALARKQADEGIDLEDDRERDR